MTLQIIKIFIDLSFFYSFAAPVAFLSGGGDFILWAGAQSFCYGLSFLLRKHKGAFLLALIPMCLYLAFGKVVVADMLCLAAGTAYLVWKISNGNFVLSLHQQRRVFLTYCKAMPIYMGALLVFQWGRSIYAAAPFLFIVLALSVVLMGMLRHEGWVHQQKGLYAFYGITISIILLIAYGISTKLFLSSCAAVVGVFYRNLILPILLLFIKLISLMVDFLVKVLSKTGLSLPQRNSQETGVFDGVEQAIDDSLLLGANDSNGYILTILVAVCGVVAVVYCFRWLGKTSGQQSFSASLEGVRKSRDGKGPEESYPVSLGSEGKSVRSVYRKFLKLCKKQGIEFFCVDTSEDVRRKAEIMGFSKNEIENMRDIYIRHRYQGEIRQDDVKEMKRLYQKLKEEIKKK